MVYFSHIITVVVVIIICHFDYASSFKSKMISSSIACRNAVGSFSDPLKRRAFNLRKVTQLSALGSPIDHLSVLLADTSVSEEEILAVSGMASDLPNPLVGVGIAFVVFLGVAVLQFSLGDLTKEEG